MRTPFNFYKAIHAFLTRSASASASGRALSTLTASPPPTAIRNVAIIAHVDHGKTTLIDRLLSHAGTAVSTDRVMDSGAFEKERGITISAKYTSFNFEGTTFNVVDTPGHADFGAEVERALALVDGALLVVDACEGPMSQTKYVVGKALARGLRPLVLLNKVDRPSATEERCLETESKIFDVFDSLGATEEQLDFKTLYASARLGWASESLDAIQLSPPSDHTTASAQRDNDPTMAPLLRAICTAVPPPAGDPSSPFTMLVSMTERDPFLGRIVTGKIAAGTVRLGDVVRVISHDTGSVTDGLKVTKLFKRSGTGSIELAVASAGDVVSISGVGEASISDSIVSPDVSTGLAPGKIDPPTLSMVFAPNNSPLAGRDGMAVTTAKIGAWLNVEAESNISLRVKPVKKHADGSGSSGEAWEVQARGELQLGLVLENMRRQGYELSVQPPQVMVRHDEKGQRLEPVEELICEVDNDHAGEVIEAVCLRKGELLEAGPASNYEGRQRLVFEAPSRGLIGFRSLFSTLTRGQGIMHHAFSRWSEYRGPMDRTRKAALVSVAMGKATLHALGALEARGTLFIEPGADVYEGMVIGEASRAGADLEVNPVREKKLTNVRNTGSEEKVQLAPPRLMTLEEAIGYVGSDELIEVTPSAVRLRKRILQSGLRRAQRRAEGG